MKITNNFSLEELCHSNTAIAHNIKNTPNAMQIENLKRLAINVLQPLRDAYGKSIVLSCAFRNQQVNALVGGVKTSQHMSGEAADIRCNDKATREWIFNYIKDHLPFDQLILEHNSAGTYWVHVSYRQNKNRKQVIANLLKK